MQFHVIKIKMLSIKTIECTIYGCHLLSMELEIRMKGFIYYQNIYDLRECSKPWEHFNLLIQKKLLRGTNPFQKLDITWLYINLQLINGAK